MGSVLKPHLQAVVFGINYTSLLPTQISIHARGRIAATGHCADIVI